MPDLDKLRALVGCCRKARETLEVARAARKLSDAYPLAVACDNALDAYDAAQKCLGAEWRAIGRALRTTRPDIGRD